MLHNTTPRGRPDVVSKQAAEEIHGALRRDCLVAQSSDPSVGAERLLMDYKRLRDIGKASDLTETNDDT